MRFGLLQFFVYDIINKSTADVFSANFEIGYLRNYGLKEEKKKANPEQLGKIHFNAYMCMPHTHTHTHLVYIQVHTYTHAYIYMHNHADCFVL